jgi:hypothetical protein
MIITDSVSLSAFMARHASLGMAVPLSKRRNNAMGAEKLTRRAFTGCPATVLQHLTRETAIACVLRLVAKHPVNAEPAIIMLTEY